VTYILEGLGAPVFRVVQLEGGRKKETVLNFETGK
jgi:hypothetical protein